MRYSSALLILLLAGSVVLGGDIQIDKIREAIKKNNASWTAGETSRTQFTREQRLNSYGLLEGESAGNRKLFKLTPLQNLPARFSWRDNNGDYITSVKNQGMCGACSYFSTCAAVESWMRIKTGNPRLEIDLSEQYVLSCGNVGSCDGAFIQNVHRYIRDFGVPNEECLKYRQNDGVACSERCSDYKEQLVTIGDYFEPTYRQATVEDIKNAIYRKPVVAGMDVYTDFNGYTGGVYEYVEGEYEGGHAVLVYGWDDSLKAWLAKNSWGESWGEEGHFKIKWGESSIGNPVVMIWDEPDGSRAISASPMSFDVSLSPGESISRYLKISNAGTGKLEYDVQIISDVMIASGFDTLASNWISMPFSTGTLAGEKDILLPVYINAHRYATGRYEGTINIVNNTNSGSSFSIPVRLNVRSSDQDVAMSEVRQPAYYWPLFMSFEPTVKVKNQGLYDASPFSARCQVLDSSGVVLYDRIQNVETMQDSEVIAFENFSLNRPGEYKIIFSREGTDGNPDNDILEMWFSAGHLVDDFETPTGFWDYGRTWGRTEEFGGGYESRMNLHVNAGEKYADNMDAVLALVNGFDFSGYDTVSVRYWLRYFIQRNGDYLLFQASCDGQQWTTLDSLTGPKLNWHEKDISLSGFTGCRQTRLRFRFVSDDQSNGIGPMIDNFRIYAGKKENVTVVERAKNAGGFQLLQNYPNPFNPTTTIRYLVPSPAFVRIRILNLNGQIVGEVAEGEHAAGDYSVFWDAGHLPSGVYFCQLEIFFQSVRYNDVKKMVVIK
ncbi:T9SS type A sorting domain-containing protein [candidate division KSB1 bacterium]|nr:T9SS type A sorting domain-containing protein [candidate division KSB1 bacterium]